MIFLYPGWPQTAKSRPSDDLPKEFKKSDDHGLDIAKWVYSQYLSGNSLIRPYEQDKIRTNRDYSFGRQDMNIYEKRYDTPNVPVDGQQAVESPTNQSQFTRLNVSRLGKDHINFKQPLNPLPKYMAAMLGLMADQEVDIVCSAIDERSTSLRKELEFGALVDEMFKPSIQYVQAAVDMQMPPEMAPRPATIEELEMWRKVGTFKLGYEAAAKDAWVETQRISDHSEVGNSVKRELLTIGKAVCGIVEKDGLVYYEHWDIADVIMEDTKKPINRDPSYVARMHFITISDLRVKCPWLTDEECKNLVRDFGTERGLYDTAPLYGTQLRNTNYLYESTKVPVLDFWAKTVDFDYRTTVTTEDGQGEVYNEGYRFRKGVGEVKQWHPDDAKWRDENGERGTILKPRIYKGNGKRSTSVNTERNVLCGTWVIGHEIIYDYGYQKDLAFDYFGRNALIPAVSFKLEGAAWVERMIPIVDEIEMEFIYLQDVLATSPKPGVAIDWKSMSSVPAEQGKFVHPFDMIQIGEKTGRWLYTIAPANPHEPTTINQKPISEVLTSLPQVVQTHIGLIDYWYKEIERNGGISDFMTGGAAADRQGLGVTQIQLNTNTNTLKPVFNGWTAMEERIANFVILKIQSIVNSSDGNNNPYFNILGAGKYAALKSAGNYPPVYWGFRMIPKVSDIMRQEIFKMTEAALGLGKDGVPLIQYSQAFFVFDKLESGNLTDIRIYMAYLEKKRQEEAIAAEKQRKIDETNMAAMLDKEKTANAIQSDNNRSDNAMKQAYLKHRMELERMGMEHTLTKRLNENQAAQAQPQQ